jgi:hypothetical protein
MSTSMSQSTSKCTGVDMEMKIGITPKYVPYCQGIRYLFVIPSFQMILTPQNLS